MLLLTRTASRCRRDYILPPWFLLSFFFFLSSFFLFFFSTPNLCAHWTDLILGQKWSKVQRAGGKTDFLGPTLNVLNVELFLQRNMISTIGKKLVNPLGLPYMPQSWWTLARKRLRTVGEFLPTPLHFWHWDTLPALPHRRYITDSRQTLARAI